MFIGRVGRGVLFRIERSSTASSKFIVCFVCCLVRGVLAHVHVRGVSLLQSYQVQVQVRHRILSRASFVCVYEHTSPSGGAVEAHHFKLSPCR